MEAFFEVLDFDQHVVKVHGSGRVTKRNRHFLRKISDSRVTSTTNTPLTAKPHVPVLPKSAPRAALSPDTPDCACSPDPDRPLHTQCSPIGIHPLLILSALTHPSCLHHRDRRRALSVPITHAYYGVPRDAAGLLWNWTFIRTMGY